jgi:hypothetical protein
VIHILAFWSIWLHPLGQCPGDAAEVARCKSYNNYSGGFADVGNLTLLGIVLTVYKQHTCRAHWWCPCWAKHKVDGTTASVCHWHHTESAHRKLQQRHRRKHGGRLAHGESTEPDRL